MSCTSQNIFDLDRFLIAQERSYERALSEVASGCKRGHWIWYIFPQIAGLGMSPMSACYSIASLDEAMAYMADEVLGFRLVEVSRALLDCGEGDPVRVFGGLDAMKVRSSMTLFEQTGASPVFAEVLDTLYGGERDKLTLDILEEQAACT